jgi:hypothetical protein
MEYQVLTLVETEQLVEAFNKKWKNNTISLGLSPSMLALDVKFGDFEFEEVKLFDSGQVQGSGFQKHRYEIIAIGNFKLTNFIFFTTEHRLFFKIDSTDNRFSQCDKNTNSMRKLICYKLGGSGGSSAFLEDFAELYNVVNGKIPNPQNTGTKWEVE